MNEPNVTTRLGERGQILAVFALALVAIVAMTGLVLDGGFSFVQRRDQQNVADAAALAAAYAYANTNDPTQAAAAAQSLASASGYPNGTGGITVSVTDSSGAGHFFDVTVSKPHRNYFAGIVGMSTWTVSTTARTQAGRPNAAIGAMPIIFNQKAFQTHGTTEFTFGQAGDTGPNPIPQDPDTFNWTMYCDSCNANTSTVATLIAGGGQTTVVTLDDKLDPLNSGAHTEDFTALAANIGRNFPVPITNDAGRMVGWAMFHLTASDGASSKTIKGWFVSPIDPSSLTIVDSASAGGDAGSYIARLVN
jgi:Flp pilus assembly protein TadG